MDVLRGIIQSFDSSTWLASVQLIESAGNYLSNVQVSKALMATDIVVGDYCGVLFHDDLNPADAIIIAVYSVPSAAPPAPGGGGGVKTPVNVTGGSNVGFAITAVRTNYTSLAFTITNAQIVRLTFTMDFKYNSGGAGVHIYLADGATDLGWTAAAGGNFDVIAPNNTEGTLHTFSQDVNLAAGSHTIKVDFSAALATGTATIPWFQLAAWFSNT